MTTPRTRGKRGQNQRRAQILEVAARLFAEKGYEATSIEDIAVGVDILKGSLYYYFRSKQELLLEVARQAHSIPFDALTDAMDSVGTAPEKVWHYVEMSVRTVAEHPARTAAFYSEMRHLEPRHAREIIDARDRYESLLIDVLAAGQEDGSIARDAPPGLLARGIFGIINSASRWYRPGGSWPADLVSVAYADLVVSGVRERPEEVAS